MDSGPSSPAADDDQTSDFAPESLSSDGEITSGEQATAPAAESLSSEVVVADDSQQPPKVLTTSRPPFACPRVAA